MSSFYVDILFNAAICAHFLRFINNHELLKFLILWNLHLDLGKELNDGRRMNKDENFRATFEY